MRTVDENHKFAVLKALAELEKVHSVCFVLSIENTLGDATQRVIKEYLAIFGKSKLNTKYHFAHTYINVENMFSSKALERPRIIEETFGVKEGQMKHHFIDNLPLYDDPISKHFADSALSKLMKSVWGEIGQATSYLCYPKSDAHKTMDDDLIESVDVLERFCKKQIADLEEKIPQFEASKRPLESRREVEKTNWSELYLRFAELDTEELVEVGYQYKQERSHLTSCTKLCFSLTAKAPIRDYKLSGKPGCVWSGTQNIKKGVHKCCNVSLEASYGDSASGSITLMGWKKEALEAELTHVRKEKDAAWSEYESTKTKIEELENKIKEADDGIALHKNNLEVLNRVRDAIRTDHISIEDIRTYSQYFAVPDVCCYTIDQRTPFFPQTLLPYTNINLSDVSEEYAPKVAGISNALQLCSATLEALNLDLQRKKDVSDQLDALRIAVMNGITVNEAKNAESQRWEPKSNLDFLSPPDHAEVAKHLNELQSGLKVCLNGGDDFVFASLEEKNERLRARVEVLARAIEQIGILVKANSDVRMKWNGIESDHKASLEAAKVVVALPSRNLMTIGQFTLMRKAIDEYGPESRKPWERLFNSWREVQKYGLGESSSDGC